MKRSIKIGEKRYDVSSDDDYLASMPEQFEPAMVALYQALITPEMTVADIGANIGMTALLFSDLARAVCAFEPAPSTFAILTSNLRSADVSNVEAFNLGLGETKQDQTITFAQNNRSGGFVSRLIKPVAGHVTENIRIDTLDSFFSEDRPHPDFIKIDVEGFEPAVIRGGRNLIASAKPTVVLELNHFCLNVLHRITVPDFFDLLRSVFPVLYAVDADNRAIADLHQPDTAYSVMHEHVVRFRFPNLVCGFDPTITAQLAALRRAANKAG